MASIDDSARDWCQQTSNGLIRAMEATRSNAWSSRRSADEFRAGFTLIELLVSVAVIGILMSLLLPAVQSAREAARRTVCQNHLRQLGLALHQFHDVYKVFPASGWTRPGPGNPGGHFISWRAMILPYIEQVALRDAYDFDDDWWSEQNLLAGTHRLTVFQCPSTPEQAPILNAIEKSPRPALVLQKALQRSDYEALMGVKTEVDPQRYRHASMTRSVMHRNSTVRVADVTDGTSNTIMVTECAARPTVYRRGIQPPEIQNDQGFGWIDSESAFSLDGAASDGMQQGGGLDVAPIGMNATNENEPYSFHTGGVYFLFADGHVQFLNENIDLRLLAALTTRAAGEVTADY